MSDIVERLRSFGQAPGAIWLEAADEIERLNKQLVSDINAETEIDRLEAEIERLQKQYDSCKASADARVRDLIKEQDRLTAALQRIADLVDSEGDEPLDDAIAIARRALEAPASAGVKS